MKVAICIPHGGAPSPACARHVMEMENNNPQHLFIHVEVDMMIVGKARNVLLQEVLAQAPDTDVAWFVDNDVHIPPHAGVLIEQAKQYGIVSGLYFSRRPPYTPQMYNLSKRPEERGMYEAIIDYPEHGFILADATGAGCLAISMDVIKDMLEVYEGRMKDSIGFINSCLRDQLDAQHSFEWLMRYARMLSPWFEFLDKKGEDFYFCERARDCGQMVWVNLDVKCEHMGQLAITEGHFNYLKDNKLLVRMDIHGNPIVEEEE